MKNNVTQSKQSYSDGGLNQVSIALASETSKNLYLGVSLNFATGSYSYNRNYFEDNLNEALSPNSYSLSLSENFKDDIGGFSATLGLLYKFNPNSRLGLTVKTPTWITVHETFSEQGTNVFDQNLHSTASYVSYDHVKNDYDVTTPFVFSAGYSQIIMDLLISAEINYEDYSQMEFRNTDNPTLLYYNTQIKELFRPTSILKSVDNRIYQHRITDTRGYAYLPSPYSGDPSLLWLQNILPPALDMFLKTAWQSISATHMGTVNTSQYYSDPWGAYRWTYRSVGARQRKYQHQQSYRNSDYRFRFLQKVFQRSILPVPFYETGFFLLITFVAFLVKIRKDPIGTGVSFLIILLVGILSLRQYGHQIVSSHQRIVIHSRIARPVDIIREQLRYSAYSCNRRHV